MPGKVLVIMLIAHFIGVTLLALVLSSMEDRMISQWSRGQTPDSVPQATTQDGR